MSEKEKFTPGEWEADCTRVILLVEQNWWNLPNEFEEAKANARLIAAAPKMFELLNTIGCIIKLGFPDEDIREEYTQKMSDLLLEIRGEK